MNKKWNKIIYFLSLIILIIGIFFILYPNISNYIFLGFQTEAISEYTKQMNQTNNSSAEKMLEEAIEYNKKLSSIFLSDSFEEKDYSIFNDYYNMLNITDDGIMGYIKIPKINCYLPIYYGTDEQILEKRNTGILSKLLYQLAENLHILF